MKLEVWKCGLNGKGRKVRDDLTMFILEGRAYATCKSSIVRSSMWIGVSDELAVQVLGAVRQPCSYVGKAPVLGYFKSGYICRDGVSAGEDAVTVEHCSECGYRNRYSGNPRFRQFMGREPGLYEHPETTVLKADKSRGTFSKADYSNWPGLVPSSTEGRLVIWIHGFWSSKRARKAFPDASVAYEAEKFTVLLDSHQSVRVAG